MRKIKIISLILVSVLVFSGCSVNKSKEVDKATQQKNITKVQNNINEIMGKDYEYIRSNLGEPYATTYYIDLANYNTISDINIDELTENLRAQMTYPKEGYESSALYIGINKNTVVDVRTDSFVGKSLGSEHAPEYVGRNDLIIDVYEKSRELDISEIDEKEIIKYINKDIDLLNNKLGVNSANVIINSKSKRKTINLYVATDSNTILVVKECNNKINNVSLQIEDNIISNIIKEFK